MYQPRFWFLAMMVCYTVAARLTPYVLSRFGMDIDPATTTYPWNFSPLMAICLFSAAHFKAREWAFIVPLGSLLVSDLGVWALTGRLDWAFYPNQALVYGCFALTICLGMWLRHRRSATAIAGTGLVGETVFFLVTNFGVWWFYNTYEPTWHGLMTCYVAASPFFKHSLLSTAIFLPILFSPLAIRQMEEPISLRPAPVVVK